VAVARALFNAPVTDGLLEGALSALREMGCRKEEVAVFDVPGAFELPLVARAAARTGRFDAVVALGAVIQGETDHYEHVAREATAGLSAVARETGVPVACGVLTVRAEEQAVRRAAPGPENKGAEAARAAVSTAHVLRAIEGRSRRATGGRAKGRR
jgi:6,7-dimethyl-8-ribityllumazine synthase